jgi:hypothetical protein
VEWPRIISRSIAKALSPGGHQLIPKEFLLDIEEWKDLRAHQSLPKVLLFKIEISKDRNVSRGPPINTEKVQDPTN